ncbi:insulin-like 3 (Leydig cell) [Myripristis murdjan]|uniref:insulin-like 3 (Leydig cell) n=1 Tax=Myripristis murdjan TaxID=586833 RepID=UPI001175E7DE|nr:relaxin-3-like [Myripristis murdjan]
MSAAKCLVSLMVVLVVGECGAHAQDRIKICGRELIRLAVSSCGNSRLRRSLPDFEFGHHHGNPHNDSFKLPVSLSVCTEDEGISTEENQAASEVAAAFSQPHRVWDDFLSAPHWYSLSPRARRAAGKISDICCERGCSVKELIQFC